MFSLLNPKKTKKINQATINGKKIDINPKETILNAALRENINFPSSCRVGGCATCKCQLLSGNVKELTQTGYILSEKERKSGFILACQSLALDDIEIKVNLNKTSLDNTIKGQIIAQEKLTNTITELKIKLDHKISYIAGQYTTLTLDSYPNLSRNYSFAKPNNNQNDISFYIKHVENGEFSSMIAKENLIGELISLKEIKGEFYLRNSKKPLLFIAGGSGLAPILAILQQAILDNQMPPTTLLFGAQDEKDLYKLDLIKYIEKKWQSDFKFIPVLSKANSNSTWQGKKGLVTDFLELSETEKPQAYLCGPPKMIDAAEEKLISKGVEKNDIFADRFLTQKELTLTQVDQKDKKNLKIKKILMPFHYLKYCAFHLIGLFVLASILMGKSYPTIALLSVLFIYIIGDAISGDDQSTPKFKYKKILIFQLWLALPLLSLIVFISLWSISQTDFLNFGAHLTYLFDYDFIKAKAQTSFGNHISTLILTSLMIGMIGTITAHELTHRTWDKISMLLGRWLLAFSFDCAFSIEHVYGHHRYVATIKDPATAPRGRNVYAHIIISTIKGNISAWQIEKQRLKTDDLFFFSYKNTLFRGYLMSLLLVILAYLIAGLIGCLFFIVTALLGKALLEIVNYMEHYGMIRLADKPVQPRHSWNSNKRISSWSMFNLTRHSHHHAQGEVPYYELKPFSNSPLMISGYLGTMIIALIPPLWHKLMHKKLRQWDQIYASEAEKMHIQTLKK